jgi:hypothetical protein
MPDIIFSYSSHHGTWFNFFAFSISCVFFSCAAILEYHYLEVSSSRVSLPAQIFGRGVVHILHCYVYDGLGMTLSGVYCQREKSSQMD